MNVRSCEYLLAIHEFGNLSNAAKALKVSQPALSSFLASTERQLGHQLFVRHQKNMMPTEAGRICLDACQRIVEAKRRTYHSIHGLSNNYAEQFSVGVTPHRGSTLFARTYSRFYRRHPEVHVGLKEGYIGLLLEWLDSGEVDLVIGAISADLMEQYNIVSHTEEEHFLCVPKFHPLAERAAPMGNSFSSIDIALFQDTPFVMWGNQTANYRTVHHFLESRGVSPTVVYESNNVLFIDSMLSTGVGIGFLPAAYCKPDQNRVYFSVDPPLKNRVGLYYRKGTTLSDAQRFFVFLTIRDQLLSDTIAVPHLNREAAEIYNEFKEADDGYAPA